MPVFDLLTVLDDLSKHGTQFVSENDIIDKLDEQSLFRNPNNKKAIRKFLKTNGLILVKGPPWEMIITYLGIDALTNEFYKSWLENIKEFVGTLPPLSLFLMERQNFQNLNFLFRNTTAIDLWATTGQNFIGYLESVFSGLNKLVQYNNQKIRILVFDAQGFLDNLGKPMVDNELPEEFEFVKSTNLPVDQIQSDFINVLPDLIAKLRNLVRNTPAELNIEIRKTCYVKFYSCIFVRNALETKLSLELYSQYIPGDSRIKFQLYKNNSFKQYSPVIDLNQKEFNAVWENHSEPF